MVQWEIPIVHHCQIQLAYPCFVVESLSDWVAVFPLSQALTLPALEMAVRKGGEGGGRRPWHCCGIFGLFSRAGHACMVSQSCGPGKVRRVRLDLCACPAAWLLWSVLSVRGEVERASLPLFRGFLEKHTSKCCPLKLLCGERHGIVLSAAWEWLVEKVVFISGDFRCPALRTAARIIALLLLLHVH